MEGYGHDALFIKTAITLVGFNWKFSVLQDAVIPFVLATIIAMMITLSIY